MLWYILWLNYWMFFLLFHTNIDKAIDVSWYFFLCFRYLTGMVDKRTLEKYEREAKEKNRETWYFIVSFCQNDCFFFLFDVYRMIAPIMMILVIPVWHDSFGESFHLKGALLYTENKVMGICVGDKETCHLTFTVVFPNPSWKYQLNLPANPNNAYEGWLWSYSNISWNLKSLIHFSTISSCWLKYSSISFWPLKVLEHFRSGLSRAIFPLQMWRFCCKGRSSNRKQNWERVLGHHSIWGIEGWMWGR